MHLGIARRAEQIDEPGVERLLVRVVIGEMVHVHPNEPSSATWMRWSVDLVHVLGHSVGGHAHDLVFALVDLESEESREGAVEEAEGMGKPDLIGQGDVVALGLFPSPPSSILPRRRGSGSPLLRTARG